jgi:two-component system, sensor histidine kinase and response regulator
MLRRLESLAAKIVLSLNFALTMVCLDLIGLAPRSRLRYYFQMTTSSENSNAIPVKPFLLCLDDEIDNLDALERIFRKKYTVLKALTPVEAFDHLDQHPQLAVIISDQRMPQITGVEFLEKSIATHPESVRILLTGYTDIDSVIGAVNQGQIYRYLTKPWDPVDLQNTVDQALEKFNLRQELKNKNKDLEKALMELQNLDQAKSQFMILINHELKTPLTTVLSFAGLMKETVLSDEQNLFADRILKSSEKLKTIIDDVLLVVKGEVGLIPVKSELFKIESIFLDLPPEIALSLKNKNQTLRFDLKKNEINSDPQLIKMAVMRALQNATKFGRTQSDIIIQTTATVDQGLQLNIQNQGPLISQPILDKLLKPFLLDENVMNHSVGMGLGLTICHTLVKAVSGRLKIFNTNDGVNVQFNFK